MEIIEISRGNPLIFNRNPFSLTRKSVYTGISATKIDVVTSQCYLVQIIKDRLMLPNELEITGRSPTSVILVFNPLTK